MIVVYDTNECGTANGGCVNGATCVDRASNSVPICLCQAGYTGLKCQTNINECASNPCRNGGICTDTVNSFVCICPAGYSGLMCQTNINECASNPCRSGGTCIDLLNRYNCTCIKSWTGTNCELDVVDGQSVGPSPFLISFPTTPCKLD